MTLSAGPIATAVTPPTAAKGRFIQRLASPVAAAIVIVCLLGLAAGGTYLATRSISHNEMRASQPVAAARAIPVNSAALDVRGQPMRWSQAEENAVRESDNGESFSRVEFKAAMKAAQYNQKNGWTNDGSERLDQGTPLRNNQKRGGDSNDSGSCLQSFKLDAAVCGDGDEGITGDEGTGDSELGGVEVGEL